MFVLGTFVLDRTKFGRHVYAVGGNEFASKLAGIYTSRVKMSVYFISAGLAALAGVMQVGRLQAASPTIGVGLELTVVAGVLLGGSGGVRRHLHFECQRRAEARRRAGRRDRVGKGRAVGSRHCGGARDHELRAQRHALGRRRHAVSRRGHLRGHHHERCLPGNGSGGDCRGCRG